MIKIKVNGKEKEIKEKVYIADFLKEINVKIETVFIAHNGTIAGKNLLDKTVLKDGDELEILRITAGG
ncbi:MAG: sulfur carrier protein ThiS [Elusimicrobiota bacterium]|nr:sulfur carrier protein ThiS [Elusimicrobiota bacterium]